MTRYRISSVALLSCCVAPACQAAHEQPGSDSAASDSATTRDPESTFASGPSASVSPTSSASDDGGTEASDTPSESGTSDATPNCEIPTHVDDIVLERTALAAMPGPISALAATDTTVAACGRDELGTWTTGSASAQVVALDAPCRDITFVDDTRFVVSTRTGSLQLWQSQGEAAPERLHDLSEVAETLHAVTADTERIWVAAGSSGVLQYGIEGTQLVPRAEALTAADDAREVLRVDERLIIADGFSGTRSLDLQGVEHEHLEHTGESRGLRLRGQHLVVLQGFRGFELLQLGPNGLERASSAAPEAMILDATFVSDDDILVDTAHALVRYRITDDGGLEVRARERKPGRLQPHQPWFLALAQSPSGELYTALGGDIFGLQLGEGRAAPDVHAVTPRLMVSGEPGEWIASSILFENSGTADAIISGFSAGEGFELRIEADNFPPERPGCPGQYLLAPGELFNFGFDHPHTTGNFDIGRLSVHSNDPDEPRAAGDIWVNRPTPETGARSGELAMVSWHGESTRLSEYRGQVVFMKLVNSL